jgi:hypothetical protein
LGANTPPAAESDRARNEELNLLLLRRLAAGQVPSVEDLPRLTALCKVIMADKAALGRHISSGRPLQPGEHSPVTKIGKRWRDEFLRQAAEAFYSQRNVPSYTPGECYTRPTPVPWQASQLSRDFETYRVRGRWQFDRDAEICPAAYQGKKEFYFWHALREVERSIGVRMMEIILTEKS